MRVSPPLFLMYQFHTMKNQLLVFLVFLVFLVSCFLAFSCKNEPKAVVQEAKTPPQQTAAANTTTTPVAETPSVKTDISTPFELNTDDNPIELVGQPIALKKGVNLTLNMPKCFNVSVAYEGLDRPRFLTISPDNRYFLTDMWNRSDNKRGKVYILDNWNDNISSGKNKRGATLRSRY